MVGEHIKENIGKTALVTGITGQDGAYLADLLLAKGYTVHGVKRRSSSFNSGRIDHIYQDPHETNVAFKLHYGDMTDSTNLIRIVQETQPDEIYNLAAQSHVAVSFETAEYTANADGIGTLRLLEAIRLLGMARKTRFYQASTSELYGLVGVVVGKPNVIVDPDQKEPPRRRFVIICCSVQTAGMNQIHHILGAGRLDQNRRIDPQCQCFVTHDCDQL